MVSTFPKVNIQICRYADGTVDELEVPRGTTAFVRGKTLFDILPKVRSKVRYAPHLYVWMAPTLTAGLGMKNEGLELPVVWKTPLTGNLHFQFIRVLLRSLSWTHYLRERVRKARCILMALISPN